MGRQDRVGRGEGDRIEWRGKEGGRATSGRGEGEGDKGKEGGRGTRG